MNTKMKGEREIIRKDGYESIIRVEKEGEEGKREMEKGRREREV